MLTVSNKTAPLDAEEVRQLSHLSVDDDAAFITKAVELVKKGYFLTETHYQDFSLLCIVSATDNFLDRLKNNAEELSVACMPVERNQLPVW